MSENISFENALTELEGLVRQLEEGKFPLEEAIAAFEKGSALRSICEEKLKHAQFKIEQIVSKNGVMQAVPCELGQ
ncbi:MAG: Exodeoxyribonuclease 7 small subunit [Holosporales bacterium]